MDIHRDRGSGGDTGADVTIHTHLHAHDTCGLLHGVEPVAAGAACVPGASEQGGAEVQEPSLRGGNTDRPEGVGIDYHVVPDTAPHHRRNADRPDEGGGGCRLLLAAVVHPGEREQLQRGAVGACAAEDTGGQDGAPLRHRLIGT